MTWKDELEEEAANFLDNNPKACCCEDGMAQNYKAFKAGAEWAKERESQGVVGKLLHKGDTE